MKTICGMLTAALVLISPMAAQAAEYQGFDADKGWNATFLLWLQKYKPAPENVSIGIEGSRIHAYLVAGTFAGTYSVQRLRHQPSTPNAAIRAIMDGGTGKMLGFIGDRVYLLTWTKGADTPR
jgi:hypothetical protein